MTAHLPGTQAADVNYLPALDHLPQQPRLGRNVREGYQRGWGIQFHDLRDKVRADPLYQHAMGLAAGRTIVSEDNRMNVYLILRFFLGKLAPGDIIEFGSYKGGNAIFMAAVAKEILPGTKVYALDTFEGMPPTDRERDLHNAGDFSDVNLAELRDYVSKLGLDNLEFVQGRFEDTAPGVLARANPIRLSHVDCDIYSAVAYSYEISRPRMVPGGYMVFDDATVSSCIGATEVVESILIQRDGLNSEQIYPHYVFRAGLGA